MSGQLQEIELSEFVMRLGASDCGEIDATRKVVKNVKLLGKHSANGNEYTDDAMEHAKSRYEGVNVYLNHPTKPDAPRGVQEWFGTPRGVFRKPDGLYAGEFHYDGAHSFAPSFEHRVKNHPASLGFSHNATGKGRKSGGKFIVEEIPSVRSVDLVAEPATTKGIFESRGTGNMTTKIKSLKVLEALYKEPKQLKIITEEMGPMGAEMDAPAPEASADDQASAAFESMIVAAFRDKSLDLQGTLAKIKEILKSYEKLTAKEEPKPETPAETPAEEQRRTTPDAGGAALLERVATLERSAKARSLCDAANIIPGKVLNAALAGAKDEAEMAAIIEEYKADRPAGGGSRTPPKSAPPPRTVQATTESIDVPKAGSDKKELIEFLRRR